MTGRLLRALAALITLLAVVVGAPIALWTLGRGLFPAGVPSASEMWEGLTGRDTGAVFLGFLVVIGFIAWAVFTVCVVLEVAALLIGRRRAWRIPLLRVPQSAATALISVILTGTVMLGGANTAIAGQAPTPDLHASLSAGTAAASAGTSALHRDAAAPGPPPAIPPAAAPQTQAAGPLWTVARYDTFWGIAEKTLGDGSRYPEIVELNIGVPQTDGGTVRSSSTNLEIGWQLRLPTDADAPRTATPAAPVDVVTVHQGDTLSAIALEQLGDATRYPELAALNGISDPDQINPGEVIHLTDPIATPPATAAAPAHDGQNQLPPPPAPAAAPADDGQNQAPVTEPTPAAPPATAVTPPAAPTAPAVGQNQEPPAAPTGAVAATPAPAAANSAPGGGSANTGDNADDRAAVAPAAVGIGLSAVLAAAVWLGLLATRRRKGRHRRIGQQPVMASLQAARVERRVRERAGTRDVLWMDNALRYAASLSTSRDAADLPDVTCVWLSSTELQLQLATPVPAPAPFTAEGDSWVLPVGAHIPVPNKDWPEPAAPFPLLTSVGDMAGETLLVDFERLGAVTLTGDATRTRDLLTHLAVELANNAWSDHLQLTLVGWGPEMVAMNPERVRYLPTVEDVVRLVRGRVHETRNATTTLGPPCWPTAWWIRVPGTGHPRCG